MTMLNMYLQIESIKGLELITMFVALYVVCSIPTLLYVTLTAISNILLYVVRF